MVVHLKILSLAVFLLSTSSFCEESTSKDDLMESESKDPTKVEIIKQIKRVNEDGSYTFGYEAEDGTFKIESRDVLGNVKGTFGFVDTDGEIKRVSYSTTNNTETATVSTIKDEKSSVIQQIPKTNRNISSSTTRRPNIIYPSPTSSVIQSIPRRRLSNQTTNSSSSSDRPFKITKTDYEDTTTPRNSELSRSTTTVRPGHYIRASVPSHDQQRFTEGQIIRPTSPDSVTPRPTEYPRRYITRNPFLDEGVSSTIKPIIEEAFDESVRGNLLRRQLSQEKVSNFDPRQHVISLQQNLGDDSTDVYSSSLTTGTPRPLFTTTNSPRVYATSTVSPIPTLPSLKGITPAKYQPIYTKRRPPTNYIQETNTDSTNTDTNYITPTPIPIVQEEPVQPLPVIRRHPFHRGAFLVPVTQGRYIIQDNEEEQQQYVVADTNQVQQVPVQFIQRRRPVIPVPVPVQVEDYQQPLFRPTYPTSIPNPVDLQDEIDSIKPPVSTKDFQKLLNRLILRQSQLQQISHLEHQMSRAVPTPVSVFVRTRPQNNGPVQFIPSPQHSRSRPFISIQNSPMQKIMESQQNYQIEPYDSYRSGRRVARLLQPQRREDEDNYLPADVREMLLLRMLQLAINPNLPLPANEGENMVREIRNHKKEVRNVEILGEERYDEKPAVRNKRYRESDEYEYY